jgi:hypothetical protein
VGGLPGLLRPYSAKLMRFRGANFVARAAKPPGPEQFENAGACLEYVPATPAGSRDVPRPASADRQLSRGFAANAVPW